MLNRYLITLTLSLLSASPLAVASDLDDFKAAAKNGDILCMTVDLDIGCVSHSIYQLNGDFARSHNEVVVAIDPPVTAVFHTEQKLPNADFCWQISDEKITVGPKFYRAGEELPVMERAMFEANFRNNQNTVRGSAKNLCAIFSDGPKGRTISYLYDGQPSSQPPTYFRYYKKTDVPPLAYKAKSMLWAK